MSIRSRHSDYIPPPAPPAPEAPAPPPPADPAPLAPDAPAPLAPPTPPAPDPLTPEAPPAPDDEPPTPDALDDEPPTPDVPEPALPTPSALGLDMVDPGVFVPETLVLGPDDEPDAAAVPGVMAPGDVALMPLGVDGFDAFGPVGEVEDGFDPMPFDPAASVDEPRLLGDEPPAAPPPAGVGPPDPVAVDIPPSDCDELPAPGTVEPPGTSVDAPPLAGAVCEAVFV